jgi:hypothetical protein
MKAHLPVSLWLYCHATGLRCNKKSVAKFMQHHLPPNQRVGSDVLASLVEIGKTDQPCRTGDPARQNRRVVH